MSEAQTQDPTAGTLLVPRPDTIARELSLPEPAAIVVDPGADADLDAEADRIAAALVQLDTEDEERRRAARSAMESLALSAQQEAARRSRMLQAPLADLSARAEDGGPVATSLVDLRERVEELDPAGFDFEAGWFSRLLGQIPGVGTPLRRYFSRYESASEVIDQIIESLKAGKEQLRRDNVTLAEDQKAMRAAGGRLERAIKLGRLLDEKLEHRRSRDLAGDEARSKFVAEELLFPLRQRIQDLQQQLLVNQQGFLTIEMITRNNAELMRGVDRAVNVTVNALQVAVTLAMALAHQRITLDKVKAVNETTNALLAGTAERLKTQGAEIQKQAASTQLDMDVLRTAFSDIKAALTDVSRYRQEALPLMAKSILDMDRMAKEAEAAITQAEQARTYAGQLTIELEPAEPSGDAGAGAGPGND